MNFLRKIAPLAIGAVMLGATFGFAAASDLKDMKTLFADANLVVGASADPMDGAAALNIATAFGLTVPGTVTTGTSASDVSEDLLLDDTFEDQFGAEALDDGDLSVLQDGEVDFADDSYDVHEEVAFDAASPVMATSSTSDDEYGKDPVVEVLAGDFAYNYVFDDVADWDGSITAGEEITEDEPLIIDFMGKTLTITSADDAEITAEVGEEYAIFVGQTVTVNGKVVKLVNVGENGAVIINVDGTEEAIQEGTTEKVSTLRVRVKDTFYSDTMTERQAWLIVGTDAVKTYNDGDAYTIPCSTPMTEDCDEDHADWVWAIDMDSAGTDSIGVVLDTSWSNSDDPVLKMGESWTMPGNFVSAKFDSLSITDFGTFTVKYKEHVDLTDAEAGEDDENVFEIKGPTDESLVIDGQDTDTIYLWVDDAANAINAYYINDDNDVVAVAGDVGSTIAAEDALADVPINFEFVYGDTEMTAAVYETTAADEVLAINVDEGDASLGDLAAADGDLYVTLTMDNVIATATTFNGFNTAEEAEADDLIFGDTDGVHMDIGENDNPMLFTYGNYIDTPEDTTDDDEVILHVPSDEQEAKITVAIQSSTTTAVGPTGGVALTDDVAAATLAGKPLIAIGGSAINKYSAQLLGLTYPTYGTDAAWVARTGVDASGKGLIELIDTPAVGTVAMVVAGYDAMDTKALGEVIATGTPALTGTKHVISTSGTKTILA
jgi:hypothetical protein